MSDSVEKHEKRERQKISQKLCMARLRAERRGLPTDHFPKRVGKDHPRGKPKQTLTAPEPGFTKNGKKIGRPIKYHDAYHQKVRQHSRDVRYTDKARRGSLAIARDPEPEPVEAPELSVLERFLLERGVAA